MLLGVHWASEMCRLVVVQSLSCVQLVCDLTNCSLPRSSFPGKNTGAGCHFLPQGIFPTQRLNLLSYISWTGRRILYQWATREAHWGGFVSFIKSGKFGPLFLRIFSLTFLSSLWNMYTPTVYMLALLMVPYRSFRLSSPFLTLFISALQLIIDLQLDRFNQMCWFCLLSAQIFYWVLLVNLSLKSLYCSQFLFGFFL